jgi:hypothetical protein
MRAGDGEDLLAGYVSGPAAATEATAVALARADAARAVVLVEGVSDQIAVETAARRYGRDLAAEDIAVLPVGGAHGIGRYLRRFGPEGTGARLAGLCDSAEAPVVWRALAAAGLVAPGSRAGLERLGFFVCVEDLEDELIRAAGTALVTEVFAAHGDLRAFRTIQEQPAWRGRDEAAQLRRFLGAGSRRKLRYARLLTEAISLDQLPEPLAALLAIVLSRKIFRLRKLFRVGALKCFRDRKCFRSIVAQWPLNASASHQEPPSLAIFASMTRTPSGSRHHSPTAAMSPGARTVTPAAPKPRAIAAMSLSGNVTAPRSAPVKWCTSAP